MTGRAREIAQSLLDARENVRAIPTPTASDPTFAMADAYQVADEIRQLRIARGEQPRGYKIGFTNRGIWARYGDSARTRRRLRRCYRRKRGSGG